MFHFTALVTCLAVAFFFFTTTQVSRARAAFGIKAPATSGHPDFERVFRVQMNTLEWMPIFLPALWLFAIYVGDAAAATLIKAVEADGEPYIGPFVFGTDGTGANNLIVPAGGMRIPYSAATATEQVDANGNIRSQNNLFMDGGEIFSFALEAAPKLLRKVLADSGKTKEEIDLFVFHQPNQQILETLRKLCGIPTERFYIYLRDCGNTVSATIPIALQAAVEDGTLRPGAQVFLGGFGVGYSWAGTVVQWI